MKKLCVLATILLAIVLAATALPCGIFGGAKVARAADVDDIIVTRNLQKSPYKSIDYYRYDEGVYYNAYVGLRAQSLVVQFDPEVNANIEISENITIERETKWFFDVNGAPLGVDEGMYKSVDINLPHNGVYTFIVTMLGSDNQTTFTSQYVVELDKIDYRVPKYDIVGEVYAQGGIEVSLLVSDRITPPSDEPRTQSSGIKRWKIVHYAAGDANLENPITVMAERTYTVTTHDDAATILVKDRGIYRLIIEDNAGNKIAGTTVDGRDIEGGYDFYEYGEASEKARSVISAAKTYLANKVIYHDSLIDPLQSALTSFEFVAYNVAIAEDSEEYKQAYDALTGAMGNIQAAIDGYGIKYSYTNLEYLNGNITTNLNDDDFVPKFKYGDDAVFAINVALYTDKELFNDNVLRLVTLDKVSRIIKLDYSFTKNGEVITPLKAIDINVPLRFGAIKNFQMIKCIDGKYALMNYYEGKDSAAFFITEGKAEYYIVIESQSYFWVYFGSIAGGIVLFGAIGILTVRFVRAAKERKAQAAKRAAQAKIEAEEAAKKLKNKKPKNKKKK